MRASKRREKNGRDTHVGKVGKRIVEFVGLVYMCEVRGQNRTKKGQTRSIEDMEGVMSLWI